MRLVVVEEVELQRVVAPVMGLTLLLVVLSLLLQALRLASVNLEEQEIYSLME